MNILAEFTVQPPMRGSTLIFACSLALSAFLLSPAFAPSQASAQFSPAEQTELRAGRLVVRSETRQRGQLRLIGGTSYVVVDRTPDDVWRALMDTSNYTEFLPEATESRLVAEREGGRLIQITHEQGMISASYHANVTLNARGRRAEFRIDPTRDNDLREGWGFFSVQPFGADKSIVTFAVLADMGSGVLQGVVRPRVHEWMLRTPELLKNWLEGSGRQLYQE